MLSAVYREHVSEAPLIDYRDSGIVAQPSAQFVDVAVKGVAVAGGVALPYGNHQFRGIDRLSDVSGE